MMHFIVKRALCLSALMTAPWTGLGQDGEAPANRFGFAGKEVFPIDYLISHLRSADFNGDGLEDLVVVNNLRSKINLLINQTGKTNPVVIRPNLKRELNELPPDARFRIDSISSEKRISSLTVHDLNGDRRPDLAYYGDPKELVVQYNEGTNGWSAPRRWPLDDGLLNPNALVHGDLNGDQRADLVLLAANHIYWLAQDENHALTEPVRIPYSGAVQAVQVLDIQGDGRDDLLLVNWDNPNPFRFRLQTGSGQLGPEMHFTLPAIRSYWADDLDSDRRTEVVTIAQKSGRSQISNFIQTEPARLSGDWTVGQFQVLPLAKTSKAKRGMAWADLNQDDRPDLLVAEPDAGQLTLYLQQQDGSLGESKTFATLTGVSDLAVFDWDGDGSREIFLMSLDERQIGTTVLDGKGRIGFPKLVSSGGRPLALTAGRLEDAAELAVIVDQDGKRELHRHTVDGKLRVQRLSETFKSNPAAIHLHDVDQDGRQDLVILIPYERIKILLNRGGEELLEVDVVPPGGTVEQPWLSTADVDGDGKRELLLAQKNFLRAVVLHEDNRGAADGKGSWAFVVKEQINGVASNSRLMGAAGLRNGTNAVDSIFLLDVERKVLTLSERDGGGVWKIVRNLPLPVTQFHTLLPSMLGADSAPNSVAFLGTEMAAWMRLSGKVWEFTELDSYETPIKDAYLHDVVSGDLNQDGRRDLVFLETSKSYLDVVTFEPPHQLVPADRWQVFEERTFRSRRSETAEPREALIIDLTGDKKNDLVVVVHDRVIVYPQE